MDVQVLKLAVAATAGSGEGEMDHFPPRISSDLSDRNITVQRTGELRAAQSSY